MVLRRIFVFFSRVCRRGGLENGNVICVRWIMGFVVAFGIL